MSQVQQPHYQHQGWTQPVQQQQQQPKRERRGGGHVTRLLGDLLIFVEVMDGKDPLGLVFRPDKIEGYSGESFKELGLELRKNVHVVWDPDTFLVESVQIKDYTSEPAEHTAGA